MMTSERAVEEMAYEREPGDSDIEIALDGEQMDEDPHQSNDERDDDDEEEPRRPWVIGGRGAGHTDHS